MPVTTEALTGGHMRQNATYIDTKDDNARRTLEDTFLQLLENQKHYHSIDATRIVIVCIGSDRATGDSLGPITGSKLMEHLLPGTALYGTLEAPVHAKNICETIAHIDSAHPDSYIIAIDASLGRTSRIGHLKLGLGPIHPGACINKGLPSVGDMYITGIVNFSGMMEAIVLQTTQLGLVMRMADIIAQGVHQGLARLG